MKTFEVWLIQHIGSLGAFIVSITLRGILWTVAIVVGSWVIWFTGHLSNPAFVGDSPAYRVFMEILIGICLWLLILFGVGVIYFNLIEPRWEAWKRQYPEQKDKQP